MTVTEFLEFAQSHDIFTLERVVSWFIYGAIFATICFIVEWNIKRRLRSRKEALQRAYNKGRLEGLRAFKEEANKTES